MDSEPRKISAAEVAMEQVRIAAERLPEVNPGYWRRSSAPGVR